MLNFKQFMESQSGLGDLGLKLNKFYNDKSLDKKLSGYFVSSDVSGTEQSDTLGSAGHPLHLPSTDFKIPDLTKTGRITLLDLKSNPIRIRLSDGTEANFTWDEYKKIRGDEPTIGKLMTVSFQRHPQDASSNLSKINSATVYS